MKKLVMVAIALSGLVSSINAETMEDFFYKRGYEVGFDEGYKAGVIKAFEEAKQILVRYDNELKAFELGKYLIKAQNLTYPRVYQEKNENNEFKFVITQSEIQKEINVEELFSKFGSLPQIEPNLKQNNEQNKRDTRLDISFSEHETGIEFGIAHKPYKIKEESTLSMSCPQKCPHRECKIIRFLLA